MLYEIVNPSDPYTIECPDLELAIAVEAIFRGVYPLEPISGGPGVPVLVFGDIDAFCESHFGRTLDDTLAHVMRERKDELAACFASVLIGTAEDRTHFEATVAHCSTADRAAVRLRVHDAKRSSLNDIGRRAWQFAARLTG